MQINICYFKAEEELGFLATIWRNAKEIILVFLLRSYCVLFVTLRWL